MPTSSPSRRRSSSSAQPNSAGLAARAAGVLAGGVTSSWQIAKPQPVWLSHGAGSKVDDADGNEYVDLHGGYGAALAGHAHAVPLGVALALGINRWRGPVPATLAPAIFASAVLVFSGVIDDFVIVDLLSSSAGNTPMSVIIYSTQHGGSGGPVLNALGSIMLVMSLGIVITGYAGYRLLTRGERGGGLAALAAISGDNG